MITWGFPWPEWQRDTCENITVRQLRLREVNTILSVWMSLNELWYHLNCSSQDLLKINVIQCNDKDGNSLSIRDLLDAKETEREREDY